MHTSGPHHNQPRGVAIVALVLAFVAAACGQAIPTATLPTLPPTLPATQPPPTEAEDTLGLGSFTPETDPPEPSDLDTGSPGTPPCASDEVKASRGITRAEADDRVTEVLLVAASTCSIDAYPALLLVDGRRNLIVAASAAGSGGIDLVAGVAYTSDVRLSNWCLPDPSYPVSIEIVEGITTVPVTGNSFPDEGDLPPCVHADADPVLSGTAWAPKP